MNTTAPQIVPCSFMDESTVCPACASDQIGEWERDLVDAGLPSERFDTTSSRLCQECNCLFVFEGTETE